MTANVKGVRIKYAIKTFQEAREVKDTERMYDMFKVVLEAWRVRNRKITMLKTKIKQLKKANKTGV